MLALILKIRRSLQEKGLVGTAKRAVERMFAVRQPYIEENEIILNIFNGSKLGTMIDVGACRGDTLLPFAQLGWDIFAFEPDPANRALLLGRIDGRANIQVYNDAVTQTDGEVLTFYGSPESIGISSLSPFTDGHRPVAQVTTTRLDTFIASKNIRKVDYLKIDTEGHDLFALKSFPLKDMPPDIILCEFEDRKTVPLGYTVVDMFNYLKGFGYHVIVSEWEPIERYGVRHKWKRFHADPGSVSKNGWGNIIAVLPGTYKQRADSLFKIGKHW